MEEIECPSVISLMGYKNVSKMYKERAYASDAASRRAVMARDNFSCQYCESPARSVDHVVVSTRVPTYWGREGAFTH